MDGVRAEPQAAAMPFSGFSPEIDGESCLLAISAASRCDACARACPSGAILLDGEGLNIDEEACVGCGLCVPACPEGAVSSFFRPRLSEFAGHRTVFIACFPALHALPAHYEHDGVPCLNALGRREMAAIQHKGADLVVLASCPEGKCLASGDNRIEQAAALARTVFTSRDQRFPEIRMVDISDWRDMHAKAKPCSPGRVVDRRGLLGMFTSPREKKKEAGRPLPGAFGFPRTPEGIAAVVPEIDAMRCTGCDACAKTCPHGAMTLQQDADGATIEYILDPAGCTGCRLCIDICADGAVSLGGPGDAARRRIALRTARCNICGAPFHYPQAQKEGGHSCRICAKIGATKKLFIVHRHE